MSADSDLGSCRVIPPSDEAGFFSRFEYLRHLFPYSQVARQILPSCELLEIGAGEGYGADFLSSVTRRVVAIDDSVDAVAHAQKAYPHIEFRHAAATDLPFMSESFDYIVSFQTIEHVHEVKRCLAEITRVLRPRGSVFLTTPNRRLRLLPFQKPWNPYHVHEYRSAEMRRMLRRFFCRVNIQGVMAPPEMMAFEKTRVKQQPLAVYGRSIERRLQRVLPSFKLPPWLYSRMAPQPRPISPAVMPDSETFFLSPDVRHCLDFFVSAVKPE
jgi:SAM-dependent methyltransferase